jgi:diaminopimelate decarboxylase
VNVDCSQNHVLRIFTSHWYHHIVAANRAAEPCTETADVVGSLCSLDDLGIDRMLPPLVRGDLVALLDTGSYAEATAANFNAELRPATVMVAGDQAEITTERERMSDVIGRLRVPARLLARSFGRGA